MRYDYLRYPGGPRGWIEKEAFLKLRTYTEEKINWILDAINSFEGSKRRLWVMYEPFPEINRDLVEEISRGCNLVERVKIESGDLDNQVTEIYIFEL